MEQIPVIINGRRCGAIHFRREGAYMVCYGQVQYTGEMLRLWLYGNGAPVYLGVLIPDGRGGGSVRKKFSLSDFGRLPHPMRYCGGEGVCTADTGSGHCLVCNGRRDVGT